MMFTGFNTECDSSSRCSTASPATDNLGYFPSPEFTEMTTSSAFIPTVTAISTSPDLQWMVQPLISSVAPSHRALPYTSSPSSSYSRPVMRSAMKAHSKRSRQEQISPEEEEKRRIRRERNKQAAAKCRNRRRELTDTLQAETDQLEDEKSSLQNDIAKLLKEKERLEFILAAHQPICKIPSELDIDIPLTAVSPVHSCLTTQPCSQTQTSASSHSGPTLSTATISSTTVKMADLESSVLEESLDLLAKAEMETAHSVPEVDLTSTLYTTQDWEPLHTSTSHNDFEPLCTPVVTCTPANTTYTSSFVFTFPESETFSSCGIAHRRGSNSNDQSSESLNSPTLLAL
uniref:Protein c-Fos n=1 Tax=Periophthalmus magnuspinnatus TaxID=409849 RepID=A0A3B4AVQ7_9GOBI